MDDYYYENAESKGQTQNAFPIIVCTVGLFGNLVVLCMIFLTGDFKRRGIHWYVLQLAIADALFLMTLPLRIIDANSGWIFSEEACKAKNSVLYINYYNSLMFLTVMALDRYFAICHNFSERFSVLRTHRAAYAITLIVWMISICMTVPVMLYSAASPAGDGKCVCEFRFPADYRAFCIKQGYEGEMIETCVSAVSASAKQKCGESDYGWFDDYDYGSGSGGDNQNESNAVTVLYSSPAPKNFSTTSVMRFTVHDLSQETTGEYGYVNTTTSSLSTATAPEAFENGCSYEGYEPGFIAFEIFNFAVMFVVPFVLMTACYTLIIIKVRKSRFKQFKEERSMSRAQKQEDKTKRRVTLMCLTLVVVFVVCWLPFNVQELVKIRGIRESESFCRNIASVTSILIFANSAANPYIYIFGAGFKSKLQRVRESRAGSAVYSFITLSSVFRRESAASNDSKSEEKRFTEGISRKSESKVDESSLLENRRL